MKLAEALILRADMQRKVEQVKNRLFNNAKVQEGEKPSEVPEELFHELDKCLEVLTDLIKRINKTNCNTSFDDKMTLADALVERQRLWEKRQTLSEFAGIASFKQDRISRSEVKFLSTVDVVKVQKQIDKLSKQFRELDTKIQGMNWTVELL